MRRSALLALASLLASAGPLSAATGCLPPDAGAEMKSATPLPVAAALRIRRSPVRVGAPFVVELRVCSLDGKPIERIAIDATMPAHRHGMNYKPEIVDLGEGRHEAKGFLFHMPGRWEITLSVYGGEQPSHLTHGLDVR